MRRAALHLVLVAATACATRTTPAPPPALPDATTPVPASTPESPLPVETPVQRATAVLIGTVTYRQRVALTPEAEVHVELRDMSPTDTDPALIAKDVITRPGQVPVAFSLEYDPSRIVTGHAYAVSARIADRGQLAFVTELPIPVLSEGVPALIEILVVPIR